MAVANLRAIREVARNFTGVNYSVGVLKRKSEKFEKPGKDAKFEKPGKSVQFAKFEKPGKSVQFAKFGKAGKVAKAAKAAKAAKFGKVASIPKGLHRCCRSVGCNCILRSAICQHIGIFARL